MLTGPGPTSSTPPILNVRNGHAEGTSDHCKDDQDNNSEPPNLARTISYDPTPYVQNVRVSKVVPTKPACNPLQFVQIKPCNLYQSAQEQLKRSEEVKKVQEIKKEEPEDWQSNLDNWKSCRRKRVEHIIDRVVEVKKLEMEDHDRTRRKSKTFSEMLEERGTKGRKLSLAAYGRYDDANDLSDLGIGTSSIKGKGNSSEDSDNQISISGNLDIIKSCLTDLEVNENNNYNNNKNKNNNNNINNNNNDDNNNNNNNNDNNDDDSDKNEKNSKKIDNRLPKTCYDSSNSKTSIGSSNQCEYTYEGAIQDYKLRILKASQLMNISTLTPEVSKTDTTLTSSNDFMNNEPKCSVSRDNTINPPSTSSITNKIADFELKSTEINEDGIVMKKDLLSKINVVNRRELFEKDNNILTLSTDKSTIIPSSSSTKSIKKHLLNLEKRDDINIKDASIVKLNRLSAEFGETTSGSKSVKERLINLERSEVPPSTVSIATASQIANAVKPKIDIPVVPIRDRLISLQSIKPNNQPSVDALCQNVQNNYNNNINRNKQETSDVIKSTPINTLLINEIIDHEPSNDKNTDESSKQIIVNNKPDVARILHEITTESTGATISNVTKKNEISPNSVSLIDEPAEQSTNFEKTIADTKIFVDSVGSQNINIINNKNTKEEKNTTQNTANFNNTIQTELLHNNNYESVKTITNLQKYELNYCNNSLNNDYSDSIKMLSIPTTSSFCFTSTSNNNFTSNFTTPNTIEISLMSTSVITTAPPVIIDKLINNNTNNDNNQKLNSNNITVIAKSDELYTNKKNYQNNQYQIIPELSQKIAINKYLKNDFKPLSATAFNNNENHNNHSSSSSSNSSSNSSSSSSSRSNNNNNGDGINNNNININNYNDVADNANSFISKKYNKNFVEELKFLTENKETELTDFNNNDSPNISNVENKNEKLKCQIVGFLEKKKNVITHNNVAENINYNSATTLLSPPSTSPMLSSPKSTNKSKHIFNFIKRNLLSDSNNESNNLETCSTFYVPLLLTDCTNVDNITSTDNGQIETSTNPDAFTKAKLHEKTESIDSNITMSSEINILLDEELNKLNNERQ